MPEVKLVPDLTIAEAGRAMMAQQLPTILSNGAIICDEVQVTAVHEMRKAIRRTFTCFKLFQPYFKAKTLRKYRKGLRRIMRRLASSRDLAVTRIKLADYNQSAANPLFALQDYWQEQQRHVDDTLREYLSASKQQRFLNKYIRFTAEPGKGVLAPEKYWLPVQVNHLAPVLIYQRVATVRSFEDKLENATVDQLHKLRIQFKELRYSLDFFAPLMGDSIDMVLENLKESQEHLGNLNDARIALVLLNNIEGLKTEVAQYRTYQENVLQDLIEGYLPVWRKFNSLQWRQNLACAVANL